MGGRWHKARQRQNEDGSPEPLHEILHVRYMRTWGKWNFFVV